MSKLRHINEFQKEQKVKADNWILWCTLRVHRLVLQDRSHLRLALREGNISPHMMTQRTSFRAHLSVTQSC